jgi:hypothetical protein
LNAKHTRLRCWAVKFVCAMGDTTTLAWTRFQGPLHALLVSRVHSKFNQAIWSVINALKTPILMKRRIHVRIVPATLWHQQAVTLQVAGARRAILALTVGSVSNVEQARIRQDLDLPRVLTAFWANTPRR